MPAPQRGQVLVRVEATSVNPIDAKRASGYGQRLLGLKGAGALSARARQRRGGPRRSGRRRRFDAGPGATRVRARGHRQGRRRPRFPCRRAAGAAACPLRRTSTCPPSPCCPTRSRRCGSRCARRGSPPPTRPRKRVLVHGAAGRWAGWPCRCCRGWGCHITAICEPGKTNDCRALGRAGRGRARAQAIRSLATDFDVVLNFASWDDELALASRLGAHGLGHATTVHPLLGHFDRLGWLRGALACRRDAHTVRSAVRRRSAAAHYAWTTFNPDTEALAALAAGVRERRFSLPLGLCAGFDQADRAFDHVAAGKPGRAVLQP